MRKYVSIITGLTLIAISVFIAVIFIKNSDKKKPKMAKDTKTITVNIVKNKTIPIQINSTGSLIAKNKIEIYSEVQGVLNIRKKDFKAGTFYAKDEMILISEELNVMQRGTELWNLPSVKNCFGNNHNKFIAHWKKNLLGFKSIFGVDNGGRIPLGRYRIEEIQHQVYHFSNFIQRILEKHNFSNQMHPDYVNYFNWHLSRIKAQIFISDFNTYLAASIEFITKEDVPFETIYLQYGYSLMPKILFNQFTTNNDSYFLYIRPENTLEKLLNKASLYCMK